MFLLNQDIIQPYEQYMFVRVDFPLNSSCLRGWQTKGEPLNSIAGEWLLKRRRI